MASVFLSYDHEDAARAAPIAAALEKAGHSVWWDRQIRGGAEYNSEIEGAVEQADVVVVLWSERSVKSAWVRDEAAEGRDGGKLVPVALENVKPPMGFRQFQTIAWKGAGRAGSAKRQELLRAIDAIAGSPARSPQSTPARASRPSVPVALAGLAAAIALLILIGTWVWRPWVSASSALVSISAVDASPASKDYARNLLAQLGEIQSAQPGALQLVNEGGRKRAGLVLEVSGATEGKQARANLFLLDGKTEGLLWSKAYERPAEELGDLRQQLGYAAARVLECAVETHQGGRRILEPELLKLYLNGCADVDTRPQDLPALVSLFRRVVTAAPKFESAWTRLLRAEDDAYINLGDYSEPDSRLARDLRRDIAAARKVKPDLAQAYLAEADLLPLNAFEQRLALTDRAVASEPDSSTPAAFRSAALFAVGRVASALDDARRAADLDPISPSVRNNYITALAQSGRTQAALGEIAKVERIWPGSSMIANVRFSVHFRFGDPRIAWQIIQAGQTEAGWIAAKSYVQARITRKPEDIDLAIKDARAAYARDHFAFQHLVQTLGILDREQELLPVLMSAPLADATFVTDVTFRPSAREFWRDPRALLYARRVGLLQYWHSSGKWPDFCYAGDLPYDCEKEAAKLLA